MTAPIRVAVVQLDAFVGANPDGSDPVPGLSPRRRVDAREAALSAVGQAAEAGCAVVVLPEYASGWLPRLMPALSEPDDGDFLTAIRAAAREHAITVVVGTVLPSEGPTAQPPRARNVTVVVGPDGQELGRYTKVHRYDAYGARESDVLDGGHPAAALVVEVPVPDGTIRLGVVTCYDLRFPESMRALVDLAGGEPPDLVAVGAAWARGADKAHHLRTLVTARAIENTVTVALASQCGVGRVGGSAVIDARGAVLAQVDEGRDGGFLPGQGAGMAVAEVDLDAQRAVRAASPVLAHRRFRVVAAD